MPIRAKPADAIPLTDAQKRAGDCFRQEFGSPARPFAQKRLYLRPQHLNRIHIRAVRRQIPQLYACGVICVVCPRRSAAAFYPSLCSILPIFLISLWHIVPLFAAVVKGDCYFGSCYNNHSRHQISRFNGKKWNQIGESHFRRNFLFFPIAFFPKMWYTVIEWMIV